MAERFWTLPPSEARTLYAASLYFVSHILARFGPERFLALYRTANSPSAAAFRAAFQKVMGAPAETAWEQAGMPLPFYGRPYRCPCSGPALELGREVSLPPACVTEFDHNPFEITEKIPVVLRARWDRKGEAAAPRPLIQSCDGRQISPGLFPLTGDVFVDRVSGYSRLEPGRYFLTTLQGKGTIQVEPADWSAPDCSAGMPVHTLAAGEKLSVLPLGDKASHFFVDLQADGTARADHGGVKICKDCQSATPACVQLAPWAPLPKGRYAVTLDPGIAGLDVVVPAAQ